MTRTIVAACVAEFLGTFALVFFGVGSIVMKHPSLGAQSTLLTVALAHALALVIAVPAAMYISGGQFNPAIAVGLVVAGKQTPQRAATFIIAQLIAAACAAGLWRLLLPDAIANAESINLGATIGKLTQDNNWPAVVALEGIMAFALVFVVLTTAVDERAHKMGGIAIGLTVGMCILAAGPLTGASMNPARTFGPALCGAHWDMHWAYWAGPMLGAAVAGFVYRELWMVDGKKVGRSR